MVNFGNKKPFPTKLVFYFFSIEGSTIAEAECFMLKANVERKIQAPPIAVLRGIGEDAELYVTLRQYGGRNDSYA